MGKSRRAEVSPKWVDPAPQLMVLGLARVYILNGTSIGSPVFAWFMLVTDRRCTQTTIRMQRQAASGAMHCDAA